MRKLPIFPGIITVLGFAIVASGLIGLTAYSHRPGLTSESIRNSDDLKKLVKAHVQGEKTLFLFYHPHCTCTSATISELHDMMGHMASPIPVVAFAFVPESEEASWIETRATRSLRRLPRIEIQLDRLGNFAELLGVSTSGCILLIDREGNEQFRGGITAARGHIGPCISQSDLMRACAERASQRNEWPTFGCQLQSQFSAKD
ncbi:MAG TPA: hypothetical protein PKD64_17535 [Pirellulaceae bacterium]|nr:hypothetical protein [Pirellulaceae bacterium]HMO93991.1 hypothetical protein [Pirellulaceae bacterium]HMP70853.1 hypothetical protein [Pirellulaceae bacterium]